jgi:Fic family protein
MEYSAYWEVPALMERWLEMLHGEIQAPQEPHALVRSYARLHLSFVSIHPFWDGNGRVARLISNLPCLKAGQPPIIIMREQRYDYLTALAAYTSTHGVPSLNTLIVHEGAPFERFCSLCQASWRPTLSLVEAAQALQHNRNRKIAQLKPCAPE